MKHLAVALAVVGLCASLAYCAVGEMWSNVESHKADIQHQEWEFMHGCKHHNWLNECL